MSNQFRLYLVFIKEYWKNVHKYKYTDNRSNKTMFFKEQSPLEICYTIKADVTKVIQYIQTTEYEFQDQHITFTTLNNNVRIYTLYIQSKIIYCKQSQPAHNKYTKQQNNVSLSLDELYFLRVAKLRLSTNV